MHGAQYVEVRHEAHGRVCVAVDDQYALVARLDETARGCVQAAGAGLSLMRVLSAGEQAPVGGVDVADAVLGGRLALLARVQPPVELAAADVAAGRATSHKIAFKR